MGVNSVFSERVPWSAAACSGSIAARWSIHGRTPRCQRGVRGAGAGFDVAGGGPIGLCLLEGDREAMRSRPQAVWPGTEMLYAGRLEDGTNVRVRYFDGAAIGAGLPNSPTLEECRRHALSSSRTATG